MRGICDYCKGTEHIKCPFNYEFCQCKEMTNEERFCQLPTEQKARWLNNLMWWLYPFVPKEENKKETLGQIMEWLKQSHKE